MEAGQPDRDTVSAPQGSLAAGLAALLRTPPSTRELAAAIAVLIALGPLATIAGAQLLTRQERAEVTRLKAEREPRLAAELAAERARTEMASTLRHQPLSSALEALARGLPADASLVRVERNAQGALEIDVSTTDPDRLRAALRRDPALARLRDTSQRQADTAMIVSMREEAR